MADLPNDEELDEDLESLDMTGCKDRIAQLHAERERRQEYTERLQVKLKALNSELAARREEVERIKQQSDQLRHDDRRGAPEQREAGRGVMAVFGGRDVALSEEDRLNKARRFIEEELQEKAQKRAARNELGIRTFDETELMIQKPEEEQRREVTYIDTVLITWSKSVEQTFNLTYRVDRNMTSKKLREDACLYWGISEVEYILKTVTTNSKVQDDVTIQNCFGPSEDAHLMLVHKTPRDHRIMPAEISAIRAKTGVKARKAAQKNKDAEEKQPDKTAHSGDFYKEMSVVPGFKAFMTQRDENVIEHTKHIRLSSLCLYTLLLVATLLTIENVRPPNKEYICRHGVYAAMSGGTVDMKAGTRMPALADVAAQDQLWAWLSYTVPYNLFRETSELRLDNYLPGWVQIRMQQVKPATHEQCVQTGLPSTVECLPEEYLPAWAGTEDISSVKDFWGNRSGTAGRSPTAFPWKYVDAAEQYAASLTGKEAGRLQSYDASGYSVEYNLQAANLTETFDAFVEDMTALQAAGWIGNRTRAVHVSFAVYNGNNDFWVSSWFLFELPPSGIVYPSSELTVYRPVSTDYAEDYDQLVIDLVRLVLVLYMITVHFYSEVSREKKQFGNTWRSTLRGLLGLADLTLAGFFFYSFIVRYIILGSLRYDTHERVEELRGKYTSMKEIAYLYNQITIGEGVVVACATWHLLNYMKINRHVYIIYQTLTRSMKHYSQFMLILMPVMLGFVVVGHALWRAHLPQYRTFWSSFTSTFMMLCGDVNAVAVSVAARPWTLVYMVTFYFIMTLLFVNSWIAVVTEVYQRTRVRAGYDPKDYIWKEEQYAHWLLWAPLARLWLRRPQLSCRRRKKSAEGEAAEAAAAR